MSGIKVTFSGGKNELIQLDEQGERVYPCWCGEVHDGPYGIYPYGEHSCFHDAPLARIGGQLGKELCCSECGKRFYIDRNEATGRRYTLRALKAQIAMYLLRRGWRERGLRGYFPDAGEPE